MWIVYAGFIVFILGLLALDLGVFHKKDHVVGVRESLKWSAIWISIGVAFAGVIYLGYEHHWFGLGLTPEAGTTIYNDGASATTKYLTGYVIEKSLAIDNIFVIALIFSAFKVPALYQHRVLYWGILGALLMRGVLIGVGATLIATFSWIMYVFGAFLIFTGIRMVLAKESDADVKNNAVVRFVRRIMPVSDRYEGKHFLVRQGARRVATPLLLALVLVEATDVIFAVDSIPAIFAITADPFLVFTSNVFAILGLRSLYFALAGMMDKFRYLKHALAGILVLVGTKMIFHGWFERMLGDYLQLFTLGAIGAILATGIIASLRNPPQAESV